MVAVGSKKMVPRVSVAKKRVPVPPTVTGSALAKYELAGVPADALQVVTVDIAATPDDASCAMLTI